MNIKLTDRDREIIKFLREYKCADTHTLTKLFFTSKTLAERRLKKLVEGGYLRRWREDILHPYIFYINKRPTNLVHSCMISEIYAELSKYQVVKVQREYEIRYGSNMIRVDLMTVLRINGKLVPLLIECDLNRCMKYKYDSYISEGHYQSKFGNNKPLIISISKYKPKSNTPIKHITLQEFKKEGIKIF